MCRFSTLLIIFNSQENGRGVSKYGTIYSICKSGIPIETLISFCPILTFNKFDFKNWLYFQAPQSGKICRAWPEAARQARQAHVA